MLKQRVITALILAFAVFWIVLMEDTEAFAIFLAVGIAFAGNEWGKLAGFTRVRLWTFDVLLIITLYFAWIYRNDLINLQLLGVISLFWLVTTLYLLLRRRKLVMDRQVSWAMAVGGLILLSVAWASLVELRENYINGAYLVLAVFMLIWTADTGAYFSGKRFGKHKLSPQVSPGKTVEGAMGAMAGAVVIAVLLKLFDFFPHTSLHEIIILCVLVTFISIGGDLFESYLKRKKGVKDSSHLLPGHGGVLDRIDSVIAASPVFLAGLMWLADPLL